MRWGTGPGPGCRWARWSTTPGPALGPGAPSALTATMQEAWLAVREVAVGALIDGADPGKVILIGPAGSGAQAEAGCAALENLARTLSVEWARYGVTTVMVAPGARGGVRAG